MENRKFKVYLVASFLMLCTLASLALMVTCYFMYDELGLPHLQKLYLEQDLFRYSFYSWAWFMSFSSSLIILSYFQMKKRAVKMKNVFGYEYIERQVKTVKSTLIMTLLLGWSGISFMFTILAYIKIGITKKQKDYGIEQIRILEMEEIVKLPEVYDELRIDHEFREIVYKYDELFEKKIISRIERNTLISRAIYESGITLDTRYKITDVYIMGHKY